MPPFADATAHIWHNSLALHACIGIDAAAHSPSCFASASASALVRPTANVFSYFSLYAQKGKRTLTAHKRTQFQMQNICRTIW